MSETNFHNKKNKPFKTLLRGFVFTNHIQCDIVIVAHLMNDLNYTAKLITTIREDTELIYAATHWEVKELRILRVQSCLKLVFAL